MTTSTINGKSPKTDVGEPRFSSLGGDYRVYWLAFLAKHPLRTFHMSVLVRVIPALMDQDGLMGKADFVKLKSSGETKAEHDTDWMGCWLFGWGLVERPTPGFYKHKGPIL